MTFIKKPLKQLGLLEPQGLRPRSIHAKARCTCRLHLRSRVSVLGAPLTRGSQSTQASSPRRGKKAFTATSASRGELGQWAQGPVRTPSRGGQVGFPCGGVHGSLLPVCCPAPSQAGGPRRYRAPTTKLC